MENHWSLRADRLSVTVGIHTRIRILKQQRQRPILIRLGGWATRQYLIECGLKRVPEEIHYHTGIPVKFRDPIVLGIAVEGEDLPPLPKKRRTQKHPE